MLKVLIAVLAIAGMPRNADASARSAAYRYLILI